MNALAAVLVVVLVALFALPRCGNAGESPASAQALVAATIAGDRARAADIAARLQREPRPPHGDRRKARELNDAGLALWQRQRYDEAAVLFGKARAADASDPEIAENLGYALLKAGRVDEAERRLLEAIALAPERASAWGSLGMVYAKQGRHRAGVACVLKAYGYAQDRKRVRSVYRRLAASDEDPRVRAMLAEVVSRLPGT
jgi:tetratricopeptide (TPR) repeat protein